MIEEFVQEVKVRGTIKSFAPSIFSKIRTMYGIEMFHLINSLDPVNNREQIFKSNQQTGNAQNSNNGGKSGSFFFFSQDRNYIVKTITSSEK
jgi:hypothetical protein